LFVYSGILLNHDSPLKPEQFVTQKIVASAVRIAAGTQDKLYLGNIDIQRDWVWAEDYVEAMYLMLQQEQSDDYAIAKHCLEQVATGESYKLAEFIEIAFQLVGLDWREYVVSDKGLCRPTDLAVSRGNPSKARERLGWVAKHKIADIIRLMIEARQDL
jgi:GDPmannose 4,6-dehydratase